MVKEFCIYFNHFIYIEFLLINILMINKILLSIGKSKKIRIKNILKILFYLKQMK